MKSWIKKSLFTVFGASIALGGLTACSSARPWHHDASPEQVAQMQGKVVERIGSKLDLNAEQKQKLQALTDVLQAQRKAMAGAAGDPRSQVQALVGLHPDGGRADHDGRHPGGQHHRRHEADPDGQLQGHQIEQGLRPKARAHTQRATQPPAQAGIPVVAPHTSHHRSLQEQGIHAERPGHEQGRQVKVGVHEGRRHARVPDKVPQSRQGALPRSWALTPAAGTCEAPRACFR